MKKKQSSILITLMLLAFITGCSGKSDNVSNAPAETSDTPTPTAEASDASAEETPDTEEDSKDAGKEEVSAYPRTLTHMGGTLTLEARPERVAAVSKEFIDLLVLLGHPPLATKEYDGMLRSSILSPYVEGLDIIELGTRANREAILDMEPDLILISEGAYAKGQFEELNLIAPTVVVESSGDYPARIRQLGELLGEEEKAEEIIVDFNKKIEETRTALGTFDETVLILRANGKNFTALDTVNFRILFEDLGLKTVSGLENGGELTIEGLSDVNPDHIFIAENSREADSDNPGSLFNNWKNNSVWQSLDAVKNDNVYYMDSVFIEAYYASQLAALDAVVEYLAD